MTSRGALVAMVIAACSVTCGGCGRVASRPVAPVRIAARPLPEAPEDFVERTMIALAASSEDPPEVAAVALGKLVDLPRFVQAMLGEVWVQLTDEQRATAVHAAGAITAVSAAQAARKWLVGARRITALDDQGATVRVSTEVDADTTAVFVLQRRSGSFTLLDVEFDEESLTDSNRYHYQRMFTAHGRDPAYVLADLVHLFERIRDRAAENAR